MYTHTHTHIDRKIDASFLYPSICRCLGVHVCVCVCVCMLLEQESALIQMEKPVQAYCAKWLLDASPLGGRVIKVCKHTHKQTLER
jgi:hypothetical protein